jgi:hypothetical protein
LVFIYRAFSVNKQFTETFCQHEKSKDLFLVLVRHLAKSYNASYDVSSQNASKIEPRFILILAIISRLTTISQLNISL